ncbi:MAG: hypothetical protein ABR541_00445 [Candidatus Dormibacteria bacterium]
MTRERATQQGMGGLGRGSAGSVLGGVLLFLAPVPRGARARLRLRHPEAADVATAVADRMGVVLGWLAMLVLAVAVLLPGAGTAVRGLLAGAAVGVATGVPLAGEGRRRRTRLAGRPRPPDPLRSGGVAVADEDPARLAERLPPREARRVLVETLRAGTVTPDVVWRTGLVLARRGAFREGLALLRRGARDGDRDARLALCEGLALAGREAQAVTTLDDMQRRLPRSPG